MTEASCHWDKMPDKNCFALFKYFITVMRKVTNTDTSHPNTLTESSCAVSTYCSFILCLSLSLSSVYARMCTFLCSFMPLIVEVRGQLTRGCSFLLPCRLCKTISSRQALWQVSTCWAILFLWYKLFRKGLF